MSKRKLLLKYVCANCGSEDCGWDAYSRWNEIEQAEELGSSYDDPWCSNCGEDAELEERPMTKAEKAERRTALAGLPVNVLRRALQDADEALRLAIDRSLMNDCEGEERPYRNEFRAQRGAIRRALKSVKAVR